MKEKEKWLRIVKMIFVAQIVLCFGFLVYNIVLVGQQTSKDGAGKSDTEVHNVNKYNMCTSFIFIGTSLFQLGAWLAYYFLIVKMKNDHELEAS